MDKLRSFRVFLNERLMEVAMEIFGSFEKMSVEYQEENNRLKSILGISPEIQLGRIDSLQVSLSVPKEQVPPEQQFCERMWVPNLGQEVREPTQIKEEQEELRISPEEEQNQGLFVTKDSILTPLCVKRECEQEGDDKTMLCEPQNVNRLKMSKELSFRVFLNKFLTESVAVKIFGTVEKTVSEYQEENDQLHRMIRTFPEMKLVRIDSLQFSLTFPEEEAPPEQQQQSSGLVEENPEPTHIKMEQEEVRTNQQTVERKESDSRSVDPQPFTSVTHLRGLEVPCEPPDNHSNVPGHNSDASSVHDDLDRCPPRDPSPPTRKRRSTVRVEPTEPHRCRDCGKTFILKDDLRAHVTVTSIGSSECGFCKERFDSSCKLKAHVQRCPVSHPCSVCDKTFKVKDLSEHMKIHTDHQLFTCPFCCKTFKRKGYLTVHIRLHTGEKPFSCGVCGKTFNQKWQFSAHKQTHTGEKQFSCDDCGKSFSMKGNLTVHKLTHTKEKRFTCDDCGKSFGIKDNLNKHKLIHTGEKSFVCGDCGKSFRLKGNLTVHKLTHTGEKPFSCGHCGKSFSVKDNLNRHELIHTGEKPFSCIYCGKNFRLKANLTTHQLIHTGETSYVCSVCAKVFNKKTNLLSHMESKHKQSKQAKSRK
ncbi:zinc finger protein 260-like isoform X2 [Esox lucius]|uniref:C2H2-type domain-containing protein n=1 Tax=Esox lucius TaxID=8010 RepID=A0A3P8XXP2_ESOLU|nr:zinc finger protein 260-like isoform X2 [Esox lucius]